MIIGFTGSRWGMAVPQHNGLAKFVVGIENPVHEWHHGDCKGADEQAFEVALMLRVSDLPGVKFHAHPATINPRWDQRWQARTYEKHPKLGIIVHEALPPLKRNQVIVDSVDRLIATPARMEPREGGTWFTVAYALEKKVPVALIQPDGSLAPYDVLRGLTWTAK